MDAFERIYETMRQAGSEKAKLSAVRIRQGTVLTVSPLTLDVGGTTQEAERIYIASRLTKGYAEIMNFRGGIGNIRVQVAAHEGALTHFGAVDKVPDHLLREEK